MLKITVNGKQNYDIDNTKEVLLVNGNEVSWDIASVGANHFHILYNNQSYNAEVIEANKSEKTFKVKINQAIYDIGVKDNFDLLLEQMGMNSTTKSKANQIKAPMPGLIWDIKVQIGDIVQAGDIVLILVAMKMENALKSVGDGKVKSIKVNKGDSVEKNQVLIEFE